MSDKEALEQALDAADFYRNWLIQDYKPKNEDSGKTLDSTAGDFAYVVQLKSCREHLSKMPCQT